MEIENGGKRRVVWCQKEVSAMLLVMKKQNILTKMVTNSHKNVLVFKKLQNLLLKQDPTWCKNWIHMRTKWTGLKRDYNAELRSNTNGSDRIERLPHFDIIQELLISKPQLSGDDSLVEENADQQDALEVEIGDRRRVSWSEEETMALLSVMKERGLNAQRRRNARTFKSYREELLKDYPTWSKSWIHMRTKWRSLIKEYYAQLKKKNTRKSDRSKCMPHFDAVQELMMSRSPISHDDSLLKENAAMQPPNDIVIEIPADLWDVSHTIETDVDESGSKTAANSSEESEEIEPRGKKRVAWSENEVEAMLIVMKQRRLDTKIHRNAVTFKSYQKALRKQEPTWSKSWIQMRTKWKALKRDYYAEIQNSTSKSDGIKCIPHFKLIQEVLMIRPQLSDDDSLMEEKAAVEEQACDAWNTCHSSETDVNEEIESQLNKLVEWTEMEVEAMVIAMKEQKILKLSFNILQKELLEKDPTWSKTCTQMKAKWKSLKTNYYTEIRNTNNSRSDGKNCIPHFDILEELLSRPLTQLFDEDRLLEENADEVTFKTVADVIDTASDVMTEETPPPPKRRKISYETLCQNIVNKQSSLMKEMQQQDHQFIREMAEQRAAQEKESINQLTSSFEKSLASSTLAFLREMRALFNPSLPTASSFLFAASSSGDN